ncbi:actin-related protein 4 [Citrus sinensis]|uniref:Actin-related protein 4 n=1 Tax=Citrus sinensis TaxID=2711 RepID=A0ACB8LYX5_CITSI|nr:actin-related protein 4 [Citrus sinensis]
MYGGDEVSAIVIDLGSHTCKAGYAGEDAPKAVFPSVVGAIDQMDIDDSANAERNSGSAIDSKNNVDSNKGKGKRKLYVGTQSLGFRRDHMEVLSPLKDGVVVDWDIVDSIWDHAFRTAELIFEKYNVPALFLAKNAVLTSFALGRATSLVVDCGGGSTTVAPVHDGYVLQKGVTTSPIGGEFLTNCLMKSLESKGITIKPRYSFKRKENRPGEFQIVDLDFPNTTESYKLYCQRVIASDIKECVCRAPDTPYDVVDDHDYCTAVEVLMVFNAWPLLYISCDCGGSSNTGFAVDVGDVESAYSNIPMTPYELPDGQVIEIGADRFKTPDVLFNPSLVQTIPGMENFAENIPFRGLPQMVIDSINKCDVDIRRELFSSILLAGGTASMQQLKERLEKDLLEESPQAARVKVVSSGNATERRFSEAHGLLNLTVIKFMFCIVASSVAKAVDKIEIIVTPSDKFVPKQSSSYAFWWLTHGIVKALQAIYGISFSHFSYFCAMHMRRQLGAIFAACLLIACRERKLSPPLNHFTNAANGAKRKVSSKGSPFSILVDVFNVKNQATLDADSVTRGEI